ncbi:MAG: protein translocase subunit SecD [Verrucomicrobia bacterium]|jgi:SecD/SecF fusion protein|nr:protein translocase subunit SecD [Verrucomicrobiota bacterium]
MTSRTWFWKIAVSLVALAVAWYEFHPVAPIPLDQFVPAQVIAQKPEFDKLHAEALERVKRYKDAAVPADQKSVSYYQALRDIGEGRGRAAQVDFRPFFFTEAQIVREPDQSKRNGIVLKQLMVASQGRLKLGLDLQGGVSFTLKVDPTGAESGEKSAGDKSHVSHAEMVNQALQVMEQRVNQFGVAEPVLRPVGDLSLEVQLPGEDAANNPDVIDALKKPAKLEFRQVHRTERPSETDREHALRSLPVDPMLGASSAISTYEVLTLRDVDSRTGEVRMNRYFVKKAADATGKIIKAASGRSDDGISFYVDMKFTDEGSKKFGDLTAKIAEGNSRSVGQLAIVLDGKLQSAPTVREAIRSTGATITGNFSREEVINLANVLNNPLEFPLITQDVTSVGPTLAKDAQGKSVTASLVAVGLVIFFMVGFYVWGGFIAVVGMVLNLLMMLGAMAYFGATITLPGVAALVLTLGMAVDANILILERVREEARAGKDRAVSLREGYNRATWTIVDANLTHLLVALILAFMGTGPVRGFGITLIIGIFTTLFTTLVTCRGLQELALARGIMSRIFGLPVFKPTLDIPFLKFARVAFIISWAIVALGISELAYKGKEAFGKDFRGGESALVAIAPGANVDTGKIAGLAASVGLPDTTVSVQTPVGGGEPTLRIETELTKDKSKGEFANVAAIVGAIKARSPEILKDRSASVEKLMLSREAIGGSVSGELRSNAIWSVILALVGIGIYVSLRFETGFGVAAMVATLHDVLMTVALFVFFGGQFNAALIAAILLIIGYSVNDTIVVFDRIREELQNNPGRELRDVIHFAINRTLSRTILTSATVFLCAVALWAFGAGDVRLYGEVFIYGVLTGTFSSIFIASPIFYWWHKGDRKGVDAAELPRTYSWEAGSDKDA